MITLQTVEIFFYHFVAQWEENAMAKVIVSLTQLRYATFPVPKENIVLFSFYFYDKN